MEESIAQGLPIIPVNNNNLVEKQQQRKKKKDAAKRSAEIAATAAAVKNYQRRQRDCGGGGGCGRRRHRDDEEEPNFPPPPPPPPPPPESSLSSSSLRKQTSLETLTRMSNQDWISNVDPPKKVQRGALVRRHRVLIPEERHPLHVQRVLQPLFYQPIYYSHQWAPVYSHRVRVLKPPQPPPPHNSRPDYMDLRGLQRVMMQQQLE